MKKGKIVTFLVCLAVVFLVALAGSLFTSPNTDTEWYDSIKPEITPPSWTFPVVWNVLFLLIAISLYLSWTEENSNKKALSFVFGINFALNILWSAIFFGMKSPQVAFFELVLLWLSIILMIYYTWRLNRWSSALLVPYLLWVTFAGIINYLAAF